MKKKEIKISPKKPKSNIDKIFEIFPPKENLSQTFEVQTKSHNAYINCFKQTNFCNEKRSLSGT
mgnify:CR=1 FL=1